MPEDRPAPLRVGLQLPQWGAAATREGLLAIARAAEEAGFDSLWVSDHVVHPLSGEAPYPYGSGEPPFRAEDGYVEALTLLGVVAGATERIRLGTSVLVLPMRETLLTAKSLASLDVLSGGRVLLAVATGWWQAEFEALGMRFEGRGDRLDEQLEALALLWHEGRGELHGRHVDFPPVAVAPRPLQPDGPEIWIGGHGRRVWRRVARHGAAGWHGIGHDPAQLAAAREGIAAACGAAGRDPATVAYSTATGMPSDQERLLARLGELSAAGFRQVVLIPRSDAPDAVLDTIRRYGEDVRPQLPAGG